MAEVLYGVAAEYAALEGWERVYDLYAGIGTIALTLAPRAGELWGIELVPEAVADAIAAAGATGSRTRTSSPATPAWRCPSCSSARAAPTCSSSTRRARGSRRRSCTGSSRPRRGRIVYVSCNPTTLAPNAAELVEAGWALRRVRPVDMFPQTHHIECVALLERA